MSKRTKASKPPLRWRASAGAIGGEERGTSRNEALEPWPSLWLRSAEAERERPESLTRIVPCHIRFCEQVVDRSTVCYGRDRIGQIRPSSSTTTRLGKVTGGDT